MSEHSNELYRAADVYIWETNEENCKAIGLQGTKGGAIWHYAIQQIFPKAKVYIEWLRATGYDSETHT